MSIQFAIDKHLLRLRPDGSMPPSTREIVKRALLNDGYDEITVEQGLNHYENGGPL